MHQEDAQGDAGGAFGTLHGILGSEPRRRKRHGKEDLEKETWDRRGGSLLECLDDDDPSSFG